MKVEHFHFNAYFDSTAYKNAYEKVIGWINDNNIDVVSVEEIKEGHSFTINVWYRESEFAAC